MANLALPEKKWFPLNVNGMFSWYCGGLTHCHAHVLAWKRAAFIAACAFSPTLEGFPDCAAGFGCPFPSQNECLENEEQGWRACVSWLCGKLCLPGEIACFGAASLVLAGKDMSPKVLPGLGRNPRDVFAAYLQPNYSCIVFI